MIKIENDFYHLGILPKMGGSLSYLKYKGIDILRPALENETEPNQTSLFLMLPYGSFIKDGHFPYFGIVRSVAKNSPISRYPMHGDLWRNELKVVEQSPSSVKLSYVHDKTSGFPFSYTATLEYILEGESLLIKMTIQNDSVLPMPYGMGIHPFFVKDEDTSMKFTAPMIWFRGDDPILGHPYKAPENLQFSEGKLVPKNGADISFGSWDGMVEIQYPSKNLLLEMKATNNFRHLILHAPKGKNFFCLEPVTHTPDAFNLASQGIMGTGIQSLGPKQSVSEVISFTLKGLKC